MNFYNNFETPEYELKKANLKTFNLFDYHRNESEFVRLFDLDSRIQRYKNANMPQLPNGFVQASHGTIYRKKQCGRYKYVRGSKIHTKETLDVVIDSCNKLGCPRCFVSASTVKALAIYQHIKDIQDYLFVQGYPRVSLIPKHYVFSPPNDAPMWSIESIDVFKKDIKAFMSKHIKPFFIAGVGFPHQFRFVDPDIRVDLKHSNHLHVIAFGGKLDNYKLFQQKHGFQYYMLGYLNTKSDIIRCARYLLTHVIFTEKSITRVSEWSEFQLSEMKKNNEWLEFLKGSPLPIPNQNITHSMHSRPAYFYSGALLPHNKRYKKVVKSKRFPKGLRKMVFRRGIRDLDFNELVYYINSGVRFRVPDLNGRWKYYDLFEMKILSPVVDPTIEFELTSNLKFGKLCRQKKFMNCLELIKNLKSLDIVNREFNVVGF